MCRVSHLFLVCMLIFIFFLLCLWVDFAIVLYLCADCWIFLCHFVDVHAFLCRSLLQFSNCLPCKNSLEVTARPLNSGGMFECSGVVTSQMSHNYLPCMHTRIPKRFSMEHIMKIVQGIDIHIQRAVWTRHRDREICDNQQTDTGMHTNETSSCDKNLVLRTNAWLAWDFCIHL